MTDPVDITVEFYGVPRLRAGRAALDIRARTVREALVAVERNCPGLAGTLSADGLLSRHFLVSLNGQTFVGDVSQSLQMGDRLLLLSADAGG